MWRAFAGPRLIDQFMGNDRVSPPLLIIGMGYGIAKRIRLYMDSICRRSESLSKFPNPSIREEDASLIHIAEELRPVPQI